MGKNLRLKVVALIAYFKTDKKFTRRLALSMISLTFAVGVLTTATFSWFVPAKSDVNALNFSLNCGKGLRVNDSGTSELTFSTAEKYLEPASSVDGRNLYFPTDGSDFSKVTSQMTFRSANVGDKNVNYIQIDFSLTAQQNHTALYINDEKTSIKVRSGGSAEAWSIPQAAALRSALWSSTAEKGVPNTPIVFNPTSSTVYTAAVADVDRSTGAFIGDGRQVAHAFSEYAFGGLPVASLTRGVETKFSYIVWLEGTDSKCTDKVLNKDIQINLAFSTSWDKKQNIRFKDETANSWVTSKINDDNYSLSLHYENENDSNDASDFNMYQYIETQDGEWTCNIPGDMTCKIWFVLRPKANSEDQTIYKFTRSFSLSGYSYDRGTSRQYVAKAGPPGPDGPDIASADNTVTSPDACQGDWIAIGDSDGSGHDNGGGGSFDGDDF